MVDLHIELNESGVVVRLDKLARLEPDAANKRRISHLNCGACNALRILLELSNSDVGEHCAIRGEAAIPNLVPITASNIGLALIRGQCGATGFDVGVTSDTTSRVITLTVTGKSPEGAASVANELADRTSKAAIDAMKLDAVNIIDRASVPDKPSGPNRVMYTAVALLAGLFVAIAIIVLQDMLDTTVKSGDDAEELLGIPVLGRMPKPKKAR